MLETAVLVAIVATALAVSFTLIRGSIASRIKGGADTLGRGFLAP